MLGRASAGNRLLIAEDDRAVRDSLSRALELEGYVVTAVGNGAEALDAAGSTQPDVVVLDVSMPIVDGLTVCKVLRADGNHVPILMLTARTETADRVAGLDAGADDYLAKPFELDELLARVRALLRRTPSDAAVTGELVRIDSDGRRAWFKGLELQLTAKEFDLLRVLVREQGKVVSREQLMREIWDTAWFGSTKTLDMHISVLRRKLGDDATSPQYIATVRGVGFRFERPQAD
jgi:DNA-binding response OmpR family regulator